MISPRSSPHSRHQENEFLPTTTTTAALNLLPHLTSPQQYTKIGNDCFCNDDANDYSINVDVVNGTKIKLGQIWRRLISFIMRMMVIITLMMATNVLWMMTMPKGKLGRIWSRLISSITSNCVCTTSQDHSLTSQLAPSLNSLNRSGMVTSIIFNRKIIYITHCITHETMFVQRMRQNNYISFPRFCLNFYETHHM